MSRERWRDRITDIGVVRDRPRLGWGDVPYSVAPYVPTPINVVKKMLKLAEVSPDDVVYDLGCGDGRILFTAVEEFDVKKAVGYDLNPTMCGTVQLNIDNKGLEGRIEVVNGNFFLADLTPASVVTLYLTTSGNSKLRPKLVEELAAGARVVSHDFPVHGWATRKIDTPDYYQVGSHKIYVYGIPEAYERETTVLRSREEESRWKRIRDLFLRSDEHR
ncbi:MAG: class I SAM-dependent methyltransferase [Candidatus Bathyarchaeota archaeon]|jgi:SAM-dependent methyltransferase|nr:class I SAM-dependent methyltransferase [Candidatus Bathyarchaeota archaeon]